MKHLFITFFILFFSLSCYSECRKVAEVKYQQQYGWSKNYTVEITFLTGYELNAATRTYNYDMYAVYGVIFWGDGQASVIKILSTLLCGLEVNCSCFNYILTDLQGVDQDGDVWNICLGRYCY